MIKVQMYATDDEGYSTKAGVFKVLAGERVLHEDNDYDSRSVQLRAVAPKGFTRAEAQSAIRAHYYYRCNHSHDCCGCIMSSAYNVRHAGKRNEYFFTLDHSRNI